MVKVEKNSASLHPVDPTRLTAQQAQAVGPVEENAPLTVLREDDNRTTTIVAHNGEDGQIIRGRGALSFRIGDFFTAKDTEQMRLTPEGNLGIGITHPLVRLDVDGLVRASQGIVFPDGSIQYSAATKTYGAKSSLPGGSLQSKSKNSSGGQEHIEAVLQNYIPKFTDNGGTLGNTAAPIYETVGGNVGIGTITPDPFKLNVNGALNVGGSNLYLGGNLRFTDNAAAGYTNFVALNGNLTNYDGINYEQLNLYNPGGDKAIHFAQTANGSQIASNGSGNTTLTLQPSGGNVGIGTTNPGAKLEIAGNALIYPTSGSGSFHIRNRTNGDFSQVVFDDDANAYRGYIGYIGANAALDAARKNTVEFGTAPSFRGIGNDMTFRPNETEVMRLTASGKVGIGTNAPADVLHVVGEGTAITATDGSGQFAVSTRLFSSFLYQKGYVGTSGPHPFVLRTADLDRVTIDAPGNVGIGTTLPSEKLTVQTASSNYGFIHTDGTVTVGSFVGGLRGGGWYGTKSNHELHFFVNNGGPSMTIDTSGFVQIPNLASGNTNLLCQNSSNQISDCNASSLRYKTNVQPFLGGLEIVKRLRPISFTWKSDGARDVGLGAEEVEKVAPQFTFRNDKGEVEGVKYDRITLVLLNAVKEQQAQIKKQQAQLERLKRLVCKSRPHTKACN